MKILISNNDNFGGYTGKLVNDNLTIVDLPAPFNVSSSIYTNRDKQKLINLCKRDAKVIFDIDTIDVIDKTI